MMCSPQDGASSLKVPVMMRSAALTMFRLVEPENFSPVELVTSMVRSSSFVRMLLPPS